MTLTKERARKLHEAGLIARDAAARAGVSVAVMERAWYRLGLRRKRPSLTGEELAEFERQLRKRDRGHEKRRRARDRQAEADFSSHITTHCNRFVNPADKRAGR